MLCYPGRLSVYCFAGTFALIFTVSVLQITFEFFYCDIISTLLVSIIYFGIETVLIRIILSENDFQVAIRANLLGFAFANGLLVIIFAPFYMKSFGIYVVVLSTFHYTEYLGIAWSNPRTLSVDSFILNHSVHYAVAAISSWLEFFIEVYFFPAMKQYYIIWIIGLLLCIFGEVFRKMAMITAKTNFDHVVRHTKFEDHQLVTHGIYSIVRHPSYVGWFYWSIGTQIILFNPVCTILYAITSWTFFRDRIYMEEFMLIKFFLKDYYDYQQTVPAGLPFIKGFEAEPIYFS